ncbi:tRNA pseudouridine(13) synthase TruD [Wenzhouxiangella sp. XN79A]|uniref:tRNA pseudouridine(13) synthase TruD n=1 Tax=Wenzhouxiangella sp. XN79A TaxID=2724193 RepID=UPI00144A8578|nr:tRNA pseudouridine(13) synthase TruD [Wenzhouxiangella sp. XN79A]NKI35319.1 tRNA pseudouridine(13) synthase TruD [Wenzhouxiangella sp. XN79A]
MVEFAWGGPVGRGRIRERPEDFRVIEDTGYTPSGSGEHLWLEIEKRGMNTLDVARALADRAGVPLRAVGFAGLKDRNAVTRQPFTVQLPGRVDPDVSDWSDERMRVLSVDRHTRKIQRGRLAGNGFDLTLRGVDGERTAIDDRLSRIAAGGVPNGFGEQRFGGNNIARAYRLFRGELRRKPSRAKRGFYLSAARSLIFNKVLEARLADGSWNRPQPGELVMLDGSRSTFAAEAIDAELVERAERLDLHPSGPLVGRGGSAPTGQVAALEQDVLAAHAELVEGLERFGLSGERRPLRMRVLALEWRWTADDVLRLSFGLRAGCYATAMLREVLDYTDASHDLVGS